MSQPKRIQRKRTKGWRMPEGAIYVGRGSLWGNPYTVHVYGRAKAISNYRLRIQGMLAIGVTTLQSLRGKDLACWCPLDQSCHADVLLELANSAARTPGDQP